MFTYYYFPTIQGKNRVLVVNSDNFWSVSVTADGTVGACRKPSELLNLIESGYACRVSYKAARHDIGDKNLTRAKNAIKNYN